MKINYTITAIVLMALVGCNQSGNTNDSLSTSIPTDSITTNKSIQCYTASLKNDSAFLSLKNIDGKIEGKLWYKFAEKDNSKGLLSGIMDNDTLKLNYIFNSEGSTSERPLKMLLKEDGVYEIYGNELANSKTGFIYKSSDCKDF